MTPLLGFVVEGRQSSTQTWRSAQFCRTRAEAEDALRYFQSKAGEPIEGYPRKRYWREVRMRDVLV